MTSRYRVEYALKSHRRDEFIEWIKGLLAVPFVLHAVRSSSSVITGTGEDTKVSLDARRRYAEIFYDIERLILDQIMMEKSGSPELARLKQLVPSVGSFYTHLPLGRAFDVEDERRSISLRRLVAPSFNDIRLILNTAQAMALASSKDNLKLVTFDGDVTLYEDGHSLAEDARVISRLIALLRRNIHVGIVTAAGYSDKSGAKYYERLKGLVDGVTIDESLTLKQKQNLLVMGGEANFLFRYDNELQGLKHIEPEEWLLDSMSQWDEQDITKTLDVAELHLKTLRSKLSLPAQIIRKAKAVGIIPIANSSMCREQLEEVVLSCQKRLDQLPSAQRIKFCAFNGGSDVWVDIGDKSLGVESLQRYLGGIHKKETLHVGDQFASIGANDFKARLSACTVWIANPGETIDILDDLVKYMDEEDLWK